MTQQQTLSLSVAGADVLFDFRRAVFLPDTQTLLVSDLHWGKGETFRRWGIPIPHPVLSGDLARLTELLNEYDPARVMILGDLIHGLTGLTPNLLETIHAWRQAHPLPMLLVQGNHDRHIRNLTDVIQAWDIQATTHPIAEGPFLFSHEPSNELGLFNWCGHIHPTVRLSTATDALRLPCFHLTATQGTLPAFSVFTGGYNIQPNSEDQIIVTADHFLMHI